jgi:hypothetical protein
MFNTNLKMFFNGQDIQTSKNVLISAHVNHVNVINLERNNIHNRENAEYKVKYIDNIIDITDKNGNEYNIAIDIYNNNNFTFTKGQSLSLLRPIKGYLKMDICLSKMLLSKIKKINIYDKNGQIIVSGITKNGLLTGTVLDENGIENNYKHGVLIEK